MSLLVILMLSGLVSVWSQSTLLDSQCDDDSQCQNDVEMHRLVAMIENIERDILFLKDTNERSQKKIIELETKLHVIESITSEDCEDIRAKGHQTSGVYGVNPGNKQMRRVYCEISADGGAWTRIMHRQDSLTDFTYKKLVEYEAAFGDPQGSHWMGLNLMNQLTTSRHYKLRVDLMDWEGETRYAEYSTFHVGPGSDKYSLIIGGYSGTAGDSMAYHNNMLFTTIDSDNDGWPGHCANGTGWNTGGWWHNNCFLARLTGPYLMGGDVPKWYGIQWPGWRGFEYSYKVATMKIQRL